MTRTACTGSVKDHALLFFHETGGNGRGSFLNTTTSILNDYATKTPMSVFTDSKPDRHPTELAMLMGARLVVAQETNEGRKWDEQKIKTLTGGDRITARFMRQDFFTFIPKFILVIAGNHKPSIQNVDEAIKRRVHMIPFNVHIPKENCDPDLPDKLKAESTGIMQWLIEGVIQYQKNGLNPSKTVLKATETCFKDENSLQCWYFWSYWSFCVFYWYSKASVPTKTCIPSVLWRTDSKMTKKHIYSPPPLAFIRLI